MSDIYREIILDYYRHPRNYGTISNPDLKARDSNPLCGDDIEMQIKLDGERNVSDIKYSGRGCAISQASASMLTEMVMGKSLEEAKNVTKEEVFEALGNPELGAARVKCALLGLKVLKTAIYSYLGTELDFKEDSP